MAIKKRYYSMADDELDLNMLEKLFRSVVGDTKVYIKYGQATISDTLKKISDFPKIDISKLSSILDLERDNRGSLKDLTIFDAQSNSRLVSVEFHDNAFMLLMNLKTKKAFELKYQLNFLSEKNYYASVGKTI